MRRLPVLVAAAGFCVQSLDPYDYVQTTLPYYLLTLLLRAEPARPAESIRATNVLRTLGKWPALVVLLVDVLKGVGAIVFARWFYPWLYTLPSVTPPAALDL